MWKVIVAVMLIFGAGVVTGGLLVRVRVNGHTAPARAAHSNATLPPGRQQFVQRLHRELTLTAEQSTEVDRIMRESHERMAKILEPVSPQTREETRRVRQQIQALLTPEQKSKFDEVFKRKREGSRRRGETNLESLELGRP